MGALSQGRNSGERRANAFSQGQQLSGTSSSAAVQTFPADGGRRASVSRARGGWRLWRLSAVMPMDRLPARSRRRDLIAHLAHQPVGIVATARFPFVGLKAGELPLPPFCRLHPDLSSRKDSQTEESGTEQ